MGGGGAPAPNVIQTGPPPVPVNPFAPVMNTAGNPGTLSQTGPGGSSKDTSGVMNTPQGAASAMPVSQSFPTAPLITGGANNMAPTVGQGFNPMDFALALRALMGQPTTPGAVNPPGLEHENAQSERGAEMGAAEAGTEHGPGDLGGGGDRGSGRDLSNDGSNRETGNSGGGGEQP